MPGKARELFDRIASFEALHAAALRAAREKRGKPGVAAFRDRVVHHAFCAVCEPVFERGFIHDSYANRVGKGTHLAVARYEKFRDRFRYVFRCDIFRYFHTIDHEILKRDLRRRLACERRATCATWMTSCCFTTTANGSKSGATGWRASWREGGCGFTRARR